MSQGMYAGHEPLPGGGVETTAFKSITTFNLETKQVIYSPTELTQQR
jgi:hypothetical protein